MVPLERRHWAVELIGWWRASSEGMRRFRKHGQIGSPWSERAPLRDVCELFLSGAVAESGALPTPSTGLQDLSEHFLVSSVLLSTLICERDSQPAAASEGDP